MKAELIGVKGTWREIADAARVTVGMGAGEGKPSSNWKRKILLAEHSPIRKLILSFTLYDLPYWVSVHLVRHSIGVEHFVRSQRSDRTGVKRDDLPQGSLVTHHFEANAQALINISRKRLCNQASKETREAWRLVLETFKAVEPELYSVCVPECVYRGFCPEMKPCNWAKTKEYERAVGVYR